MYDRMLRVVLELALLVIIGVGIAIGIVPKQRGILKAEQTRSVRTAKVWKSEDTCPGSGARQWCGGGMCQNTKPDVPA